jgi:hypothetical protein
MEKFSPVGPGSGRWGFGGGKHKGLCSLELSSPETEEARLDLNQVMPYKNDMKKMKTIPVDTAIQLVKKRREVRLSTCFMNKALKGNLIREKAS